MEKGDDKIDEGKGNEEKAEHLRDGSGIRIKKNRKCKGTWKGREEEERSKLLRNRKSAMKGQNKV